MSEPLLKVERLRVAFPGQRQGLLKRAEPVFVIDGLSFAVEKGEAFGIIGGSGSGKTTLLRTLVLLIRPTAGTVRFEGQDVARLKGRRLKEYRRRVQIIFQNPYTAFHPRMTVGEALAEPLVIHNSGTPTERRQRIADALEMVGMDPDFVTRYPNEFSGGQIQRLGVARALILGADLLLADEPVSSLDVSIQAQVLNLFQDLREKLGLTYVVIASDLAVVRHLCNRMAIMSRGRFVEIGATEDVYGRPAHPYTKALLAAVPTIKRGVSSLGLPEAQIDVLQEGHGQLTEVEPGHFVALKQ